MTPAEGNATAAESPSVRGRPSFPPRLGFSWLGYIAACWTGTMVGGFGFTFGPALWSAVSGGTVPVPDCGTWEALQVFGPLVLVSSSVLSVVAMLLLAPLALPLLTTMHHSGLVRRHHAILGACGFAALFAIVVSVFLFRPDLGDTMGRQLATLMAYAIALVVLPGTVAGLVYRAIALRRGRLKRLER